MDPTQIPLRDLHLPDPLGWWPLAPGWWFLILMAAVLLGWLVLRALRRYRAGAARRFALRALKRIEKRHEQGECVVALSRDISALLRRAMLAYAPRADIAGLTGAAWLQWLDAGLANPVFETGPGRALAELPYRDPQQVAEEADFNGLIYAVRMRLATPVAEPR